MNRKKFYIIPALLLVLILFSGLSFDGRALTAQDQQPQTSLLASQRVRAQSVLARVPATYSGYTRVTDNEEKITVQVPVEWSDIETGEWTFTGKNVGVFVAASVDLANFYSTRSESGVLIGVSRFLARSYDKESLLRFRPKIS